MVNSIPVILISLLASTFFSGMEIAFVSSDKLRIELDKTKKAGFIGRFIENSDQYTATMLIGNIAALITFSFASISFLYPLLAVFHSLFLIIVIQVTAASVVFLIMSYLLPKAIFNINPNRILKLSSLPAAFFFYLFYPITWTCIIVARSLSGKWYHKTGAQTNLFGKITRDISISEVENSMGDTHHELESEIKLFKNALEFTKVRVRDCMIQRPDMEVMEETSDIEQLRQKFTETGFSKILIYKDHIDNIVGYVHSFDLFNQPENINSCLREISFVPETMEAKKLLSKLLREHKSIAIVVDEFGGTAGMITTEDILEEIFGEIEDEHDKHDFISKKIDETRYIFSGRLEIETINEMYNLDLEIDISYETIAGYILFHHSSFPKSNSILQIGKHEFRILRSSRTSIDLVEMRILEK
jgi:CBS domain containing-hemolysin-like protein